MTDANRQIDYVFGLGHRMNVVNPEHGAWYMEVDGDGLPRRLWRYDGQEGWQLRLRSTNPESEQK